MARRKKPQGPKWTPTQLRENQAYSLKLGGASLIDICRVVGWKDCATACRAIKRARERMERQDRTSVEIDELARAERVIWNADSIIRHNLPFATPAPLKDDETGKLTAVMGDPEAALMVSRAHRDMLAAMALRCRIHGILQPQKVEHSGPGGAPIQHVGIVVDFKDLIAVGQANASAALSEPAPPAESAAE